MQTETPEYFRSLRHKKKRATDYDSSFLLFASYLQKIAARLFSAVLSKRSKLLFYAEKLVVLGHPV